MQYSKLLGGSAVVGLIVAIVFIIFEFLLHEAIHLVWLDLFDSESHRLVTVGLVMVLGLVYFGAVHYLDSSEQKKKRTLIAELPAMLFIGFLSLFAGATLGPEAVLIPAALICGKLGAGWFRLHEHKQLLGISGFVALFVAFFGSLFGGLLGFYLAKKSMSKERFTAIDYVSISLAAIAAYLVLGVFENEGAFRYPGTESGITVVGMVVYGLVLLAGVLYQKLLGVGLKLANSIASTTRSVWWKHALIASGGLATLYMLGGYYVQFTGNEAIVPVFQDATTLGLIGLIWISIVKVAAISWSVAMGYRGGLVFPLVLVASSVVAIATLYTYDFNIVLAIFVFLAGLLYADRNTKLVTGH